MALRTIPIRRAAHRPHLFMGADREMVMFSGLLAAILIFAAQTWFAILLGLILWFSTLNALRIMAKSDPLMRFIYLRQRHYKPYYPPRATAFRVNTHSQARLYK
ncbi:conjugal transfer protein TrbD [Legionella fairfieldensis]|uniref:conjugal transfer protein TrbD n=1 Tax=Legionella fairfieldensis TaxID=45064 RepID=UPI00048C8356|nr:conjugal transfer protein TrbD [Legionella fairfieldensis]